MYRFGKVIRWQVSSFQRNMWQLLRFINKHNTPVFSKMATRLFSKTFCVWVTTTFFTELYRHDYLVKFCKRYIEQTLNHRQLWNVWLIWLHLTHIFSLYYLLRYMIVVNIEIRVCHRAIAKFAARQKSRKTVITYAE